MRVTAVRKGYFGGKIRDAGEVFDLPDALMKKGLRPSWVEPASGASILEPESEPDGEPLAPTDAKPEARKRGRKPKQVPSDDPNPTGNGLTEALGGPPPDWIPGNIGD
jgi:hypothetical protein